MFKLFPVITKTYNQFAPLFLAKNITFDLDFPDPTSTITRLNPVKKQLEDILHLLNQSPEVSTVSLLVAPNQITIKTNAMISAHQIESTNRSIVNSQTSTKAISNLKIKTKLGFGTTFLIDIN